MGGLVMYRTASFDFAIASLRTTPFGFAIASLRATPLHFAGGRPFRGRGRGKAENAKGSQRDPPLRATPFGFAIASLRATPFGFAQGNALRLPLRLHFPSTPLPLRSGSSFAQGTAQGGVLRLRYRSAQDTPLRLRRYDHNCL